MRQVSTIGTRTRKSPGAAAVAAAFVALAAGLVPLARPALAQQPMPGAAAPQGVPRIPVDSVVVYGTTRTKPEDVKSLFGIASRDTITYRDLEKGIRRLYGSGEYRDVQVFARGATSATSPVTLVVQVEEQPFVADVKVNGLEHVSPGTLTDSVMPKGGGPLHPEKITEAEARVRRQLAAKGFQVKKIEHQLVPLPNRAGENQLVFNIDEGRRVAIADVAFEGNKLFSSGALKDAMVTKPEGFLWFRQGTYDEDKVRKDVRESLPSFYAAHGYIDAQVTGDTLVVDPQTGKARLVMQVSEGPQYRLASFDIRGNHHFPTEDLKKYFEQDRGGLLQGLGLGSRDTSSTPVFDQAAFDAATDKVRQLYSNQGYLYANVEPVVLRDSAGGKPVVNVAWEIDEKQPAYVNKVTIAGNSFTHERIIRNAVLLLPGDVYNEDLLVQSYRNINALGFFESPVPSPKIDPDPKTGDVNITFNVKERQTGSINFGTAVGGGTGVAGFLGYDQPNLFGEAKSGHLRWEFGKYSNDLEASYTDPSVMNSDISGTLSLFSARDRFFTFSEGQRRRTGGEIRFGLPLPSDRSGRTRLFIGYSLARTTYEKFEDVNGSNLFGLPPGLQSTVSFDLVRNTLDSPMFPTVGTKQEFQADFNGGPLGGNAQFQKYQVTGQWYVPVGQLGGGGPGGRPIRFTLGLTAQGGALFGNASNFPFERFWMGGVQFGLPLRGYDETTITPLGYIARCSGTPGCPPLEDRLGDSFLRLSAEYAARINDNLSLSLFYDAGGLYRTPGQIDPTRLLRGAGLGVTIVTPFGPLGLDYAYGFDKDRPGWQLHFKFGAGF